MRYLLPYLLLAAVTVGCGLPTAEQIAAEEAYDAALGQVETAWELPRDSVPTIMLRARQWLSRGETYRISVQTDYQIEAPPAIDIAPGTVSVDVIPVNDEKSLVVVYVEPKDAELIEQARRVGRTLAYYMQTGTNARDGLTPEK